LDFGDCDRSIDGSTFSSLLISSSLLLLYMSVHVDDSDTATMQVKKLVAEASRSSGLRKELLPQA
jgi:hypothetical protein